MPGLKIKNIKAEGFLSFEEIEINNINENINFIVGPNGSGKTNFLRLIEFVKYSMSSKWYLIPTEHYINKSSNKIHIEMDIEILLENPEIEKISYLFALILYYDNKQKNSLPNPPNPTKDFSTDNFKKLMGMFKQIWNKNGEWERGILQIEYDSTNKLNITYKPSALQNLLRINLLKNNSIGNWLITGEYTSEKPQEKMDSLDIGKINIILTGSNNVELYNVKNLTNDEIINIDKKIAEIDIANNLKIEEFIKEISENKDVSFFNIFSWIFKNSITTLNIFRCPLKKENLTIEDINKSHIFNGNNLLEFLLNLKINKFNDYEEVKKVFKDLSDNKDFDIKIKEIKRIKFKEDLSSSNPVIDIINQTNGKNTVKISLLNDLITLDIYFKNNKTDLEEYPFEFSPSGYYEILVLSTVIAGNKNKVIVLDEPAQNLHPTLQHKLLLNLDKYTKDNANQFFIITHSPDMVKIDKESNYKIFIFKYIDKKTSIIDFTQKLTEKDINLFLKYEELKRLFFAKGIICGEGFSEEILVKYLLSKSEFINKIKNEINYNENISLSSEDIEIVNLEGQSGINDNFVKFITIFQIPNVWIIDEEKENDTNRKNFIENHKEDLNLFTQDRNFEENINKIFPELSLEHRLEEVYKLIDFLETNKENIIWNLDIYKEAIATLIKEINIGYN